MPKRLSTPPILYVYCIYVYVHNGAQQQQQPKKVVSHIATTVPKNKQHCICFVPQLKSKRKRNKFILFLFQTCTHYSFNVSIFYRYNTENPSICTSYHLLKYTLHTFNISKCSHIASSWKYNHVAYFKLRLLLFL